MAPAGSRKEKSTSKPGALRGFNEEKAPKTIAIEAPDPTRLASNEAIRISLSRI